MSSLLSCCLDSSSQLLTGILSITKEHISIILDEDWIIHSSIPSGETALHDNHLLGIPHTKHGHASNLRVGIVLGGRVDSVVCSNHKGDVCLLEIVINFLQFFNNAVIYSSLGEKNIQLARHTSGNGVDGKSNFLSSSNETVNHILQRVLTLGYSQTVSRHDDNTLRIDQKLNCILDVSCGRLSLKLDCLSSRCVLCTISTKDDTQNVTVHGITHDLSKCCSTAPDECSDGSENGHVKHKSLCAKSPPRIRVQNSDYNRHVGSSNGSSHVPSQDSTCGQRSSQSGDTSAEFGGTHKDGSSSKCGNSKTCVDLITSRMLQSCRTKSSIELSKSNQ
mmetsp:Transcript_4605/g.7002  ORF Transcript_4605/g.7002 Transcript_4605/m.7002 type:complete len:334 (+) Transcript_4605:83-1084(+)